MYYFEPVLAFVCLTSACVLFLAWRVLTGSDQANGGDSSRRFFRQNLASTGNFLIPVEIRESYHSDETQVHEYSDVHCSYHGLEESDVHWSDAEEL